MNAARDVEARPWNCQFHGQGVRGSIRGFARREKGAGEKTGDRRRFPCVEQRSCHALHPHLNGGEPARRAEFDPTCVLVEHQIDGFFAGIDECQVCVLRRLLTLGGLAAQCLQLVAQRVEFSLGQVPCPCCLIVPWWVRQSDLLEHALQRQECLCPCLLAVFCFADEPRARPGISLEAWSEALHSQGCPVNGGKSVFKGMCFVNQQCVGLGDGGLVASAECDGAHGQHRVCCEDDVGMVCGNLQPCVFDAFVVIGLGR